MNATKVLLPVDGSEFTKRMLGWLAAHDEMRDAQTRYAVLTVVPELPRHAGFFDLGDLDAYYESRAQEVLKPVRAFIAQKGWNASFEHRVGNPAEVIAKVATDRGFDLIVLGSHGHSALTNLALGSVATGVLARCKTPVLLIR